MKKSTLLRSLVVASVSSTACGLPIQNFSGPFELGGLQPIESRRVLDYGECRDLYVKSSMEAPPEMFQQAEECHEFFEGNLEDALDLVFRKFDGNHFKDLIKEAHPRGRTASDLYGSADLAGECRTIIDTYLDYLASVKEGVVRDLKLWEKRIPSLKSYPSQVRLFLERLDSLAAEARDYNCRDFNTNPSEDEINPEIS